ncbi:MAG: multicopper oxidase domain-containing protein [Gammaproteobacteria bacterium]
MNEISKRTGRLLGSLVLGLGLALSWSAARAVHDIPGIDQADGAANTASFSLYAYPFNIPLPEGTSLYMWGFGDMTGSQLDANGQPYYLPQYPAPTLIVDQGDAVTITMTNYGVPQPVSIVVTGHEVAASGGTPGLVTQAAPIGDTVAYSFTADEPGTYVYHSLDGPNPGLHAEMGLQGVLIVRPAGFDAAEGSPDRKAYGAAGSEYEQEFLYLLTEVDPEVHAQMERGHYTHFTNSDRFAKVWFVNGRVFPDLFQGDFNPLYPNQPYQSLAMAHPGDRVLVRNVNAGHDSHPFHYHGENLTFIARDGGVLSSDGGATADLGRSDNTINSAPKQAIDAVWKWTGKDLNWDIYGPVTNCTDADHNMEDDLNPGVLCHDDICIDGDGDGFDDVNHEYCADHGKALPVTLPGVGELTLGAWYSGSPFMGDVGDLPPGEGGLNPFGGYFFVWHSHAEKELTTFDIFPGGSLSAVVVLPPYVDIE